MAFRPPDRPPGRASIRGQCPGTAWGIWGDWTQRMATDSATKRRFTTSPKSTVQPKVDRNRRRSASERQSRGGTGWSASQPPSAPSKRPTRSTPASSQPRVIKPGRPEAGRCFSQQPHGTLAEILRRVLGTRPSEVAQLTSAGAVSASDMPMIGVCNSSAATESPDRRCSTLEIS